MQQDQNIVPEVITQSSKKSKRKNKKPKKIPLTQEPTITTLDQLQNIPIQQLKKELLLILCKEANDQKPLMGPSNKLDLQMEGTSRGKQTEFTKQEAQFLIQALSEHGFENELSYRWYQFTHLGHPIFLSPEIYLQGDEDTATYLLSKINQPSSKYIQRIMLEHYQIMINQDLESQLQYSAETFRKNIILHTGTVLPANYQSIKIFSPQCGSVSYIHFSLHKGRLAKLSFPRDQQWIV